MKGRCVCAEQVGTDAQTAAASRRPLDGRLPAQSAPQHLLPAQSAPQRLPSRPVFQYRLSLLLRSCSMGF
eukprot:6182264-Pleurochrysis_carterae.AAC.1